MLIKKLYELRTCTNNSNKDNRYERFIDILLTIMIMIIIYYYYYNI